MTQVKCTGCGWTGNEDDVSEESTGWPVCPKCGDDCVRIPQEPKHTPGPWTYDKYECAYGRDIYAGDVWVGDAKGPHDGVSIRFPTSEECEANARLIAAAPDLLEALAAILSRYKAVSGCCEKIIKDVETAIAKAIDTVR